jgi:hypothetical protein
MDEDDIDNAGLATLSKSLLDHDSSDNAEVKQDDENRHKTTFSAFDGMEAGGPAITSQQRFAMAMMKLGQMSTVRAAPEK